MPPSLASEKIGRGVRGTTAEPIPASWCRDRSLAWLGEL